MTWAERRTIFDKQLLEKTAMNGKTINGPQLENAASEISNDEGIKSSSKKVAMDLLECLVLGNFFSCGVAWLLIAHRFSLSASYGSEIFLVLVSLLTAAGMLCHAKSYPEGTFPSKVVAIFPSLDSKALQSPMWYCTLLSAVVLFVAIIAHVWTPVVLFSAGDIPGRSGTIADICLRAGPSSSVCRADSGRADGIMHTGWRSTKNNCP